MSIFKKSPESKAALKLLNLKNEILKRIHYLKMKNSRLKSDINEYHWSPSPSIDVMQLQHHYNLNKKEISLKVAEYNALNVSVIDAHVISPLKS